MSNQAPSRSTPQSHLRNAEKLSKIPIKVAKDPQVLRKPEWIRIKVPTGNKINQLKATLREHQLHTVCEEAACPNLAECFNHGTATFMIMGDICTRRCPFCDVAHGRPQALDPDEPTRLAETIAAMQLSYVVITSVDRDDLRDGGAAHFVECISAIRQHTPATRIEILVPDFRGRLDAAIAILGQNLSDIFNHNLETVPRLYKQARPGADYRHSLLLLQQHAQNYPQTLTKSGLMLGLGETREEIQHVMQDLLDHGCSMLTLGQYLQPSQDHLPVKRYVPPSEFAELAQLAKQLGFAKVTSGPLVRSSYHAEEQTG